jgi:hypothetical protein
MALTVSDASSASLPRARKVALTSQSMPGRFEQGGKFLPSAV